LLTEETMAHGLSFLSDIDPDLAEILNHLGPPPLRAREPGFPTLVYLILEQQVSLASARATYDRLADRLSPLTPEGFLELDDATLKNNGFSRQKTAYCRHLALSILENRLNLPRLGEMDTPAARSELMKIKGIGPWTADIYLLSALGRPDIWPNGDLALAVSVQKVKNLDSRPTPDELEAISTLWHPWRAVAARILWHDYLSNTERTSRSSE
jgi:DNA-3-methyladenine glycosylase II